jgi:hypothetical protein
VWELWTGESAFEGQHLGQVCSAVVVRDERPPVPADMPRDYAALMQACWVREPEERPGMSAVRDRLRAMRAAMSDPQAWLAQEQQPARQHGEDLVPG